MRLFRATSSKTIEFRFTLKRQKHPPEVFCKKGSCEKFRKVHSKTPVPESLFRKETLAQAFSAEFCKISKNVFFTEQLLTTAFDASVT